MTTETKPKNAKKKILRWLVPVLLLALVLLALLAAGGSELLPPADGATEVTPSPMPSPTPLPPEEGQAEPEPAVGYFPTKDGLFRPEAPFTRGDGETVWENLTGERPDFGEDSEPFTEEEFPLYLMRYFPMEAVHEAFRAVMGRGDELVSRSQAAVCLNLLLGLPEAEKTGAYYPDVAPEDWGRLHILAAAGPSGLDWGGADGRAPEGNIHVNGYLYSVDERGYFRKNTYVGSLYFDGNGRYASGSPELDDYVAAALLEQVTPDMEPVDALRKMYNYTRENHSYLKRNYYNTGDIDWQLQEALTMYSTGKGNCYCYASAFWAAARGLGFDAKIVSGTIGKNLSPHGWVEIPIDGVQYTFDVEIEMARRRDGEYSADMFMMKEGYRSFWGYVEYAFADNMIPRERPDGFLPY